MTPYQLQAGQTYAVVVSALGSVCSYEWLVALNGYPNGTGYCGFAGGTYIPGQSVQFPFRVNGVVGPTVIPINFDAMPGVVPNQINIKAKGKGVLPVAVLGSADFDVTTLDPSTIELGDPALTGTVQPVRYSLADVNLDGRIDLALKFDTSAMVAAGAIDAASKELLLTGKTTDGSVVEGKDAIVVVH
ncbi:MAG TPA: hypothetical protein VGM51_12055 [Armatimonadota bacterium]|jgi:hypothetical protein